MNHGMSTSRRRVLCLGIGAFGAAILAACGQAAAPTEAPKAAAPATQAPAAAPTQPAAAAPKPTEAPKAAAPAAGSGAKATLTIWEGTDYIEEVTKLMGSTWSDWAKQSNVELTFEEKSGDWGPQLNAAVQAGTPPDI